MADRTPLSLEEIEEVKRLFGSPFFIPAKFKSWMGGQLALNIPDLPLGSLFSGRGITRNLDSSTTAVAAPANGAATTLYSKIIPARTLGSNGRIRFVLEGNQVLASASNTRYIDLVFGGTTLCTVVDVATTTNRHVLVEGEIYNANTPARQFGRLDSWRLTDGLGPTNTFIYNANGAATEDTLVDQTLEIQVRWASVNAGDIFTLAYINVEAINPIPLASA